VTEPVVRVGGRILMVDPDERVLLIHELIEDGQTHWLTPGGGIEPGESPRQAAVREVAEETGVAVVLTPEAPVLLVTQRLWSWAGVSYDQLDFFFQARVPSGLEVAPRQLTDPEAQTLIGYGWWSAAELRATDEIVEPAELADLLDRLRDAQLAGG